jgi:hypothetical protein
MIYRYGRRVAEDDGAQQVLLMALYRRFGMPIDGGVVRL